MKNSLCHETLVLFQRENHLSRKHIKRAINGYINCVGEFWSQLFRLLRQEHFCSMDTTKEFYSTFIMNMLSSKVLLNFVLISVLVPTVHTNNQPHSFM